MNSDSILSILGEKAVEYAADGNFRISIKTNLGPEIEIFSGEELAPDETPSPSLLDRLGVESSIIVRNADGEIVTTYGDIPQTNLVKVTALGVSFSLLSLFILKGVKRAIKYKK